MLDRGYGTGDPALWLVHWRSSLRTAAIANLDVRISRQRDDKHEAISLMPAHAFQERAEALVKYGRVSIHRRMAWRHPRMVLSAGVRLGREGDS
jgi:hypothetical protein